MGFRDLFGAVTRQAAEDYRAAYRSWQRCEASDEDIATIERGEQTMPSQVRHDIERGRA